jgi:AsmA protein
MTPYTKRTLVAVGGLLGLAVLVAVVMALRWRTNARPALEAAASQALGLEVTVGSQIGFSVFPQLQVTLQDVHLRRQGSEIASAGQAALALELSALLRGKLRFGSIALKHVRVSLERDHDGRFGGTLPTFSLAKLSVTDAALVYSNQQSGSKISAANCNLSASHLQISSNTAAVAADAELICGELQTRTLAASGVRISIHGKDGILEFKPITLQLFGGSGVAAVHANFTGTVPVYQVNGSLTGFRIEEFFKTLSPKRVGEGATTFSTVLSMQGATSDALRRSAAGTASLHGDNLTLAVGDLDQQLSRFESSQNFSLVDFGAFFFAGPLGIAATKSYDFASLYKGSGSSTAIQTLVSNWKVEHGVAQALDVAMATAESRVALTGALNFTNDRYEDVKMAVVDDNGCATVQQRITGTFANPVIERPSAFQSLTGSTRNLLRKAAKLLGQKCTVFYAGSVAPR